MFKFNQLSILDNKLTIDVQVENEFEDYYIQSVSVSNQVDYLESDVETSRKLYDYTTQLEIGDITYDEDSGLKAELFTNSQNQFSFEDYSDGVIYSKGTATATDYTDNGTSITYTADVNTYFHKNDQDEWVEDDPEGWTITFEISKYDPQEYVQITYHVDNQDITDDNCKVPYKKAYKHIIMYLTCSDLVVYNYKLSDLLFIYAMAQTSSSIDTLPCGEKEWIVHPVVDMLPFYCRGMNFVKSLGDTCNIPRKFIDYILMYKAFELSLYTGNYLNAIRYFNDFKRVKSNSGIQIKQRRGGGCGCH